VSSAAIIWAHAEQVNAALLKLLSKFGTAADPNSASPPSR
jgi:hypothetical protein